LQVAFLAVSRRHIILTRVLGEKDHLSDLRVNVINPLIVTVSNFSFTLSDFTFSGFRYHEGVEVQSDDIPFEDFMTNHYPDIRSKLGKSIKLSLDLANKKHHLLNELKANLSDAFRDLKATENQRVNSNAIDTLSEIILDGYDRSFLRITDYVQSRILYFYPVEYPMIAFSDAEKYEIFSSALTNEETNVRSVNTVKDTLIESIDKIMNQLASELRSYNDSKSAFSKERNALLDRLLRVKYSTKLNYEKEKMRKKCSLA
jgi:hypothetical protein